MSGSERIARLRIELADIAPSIWRRVEVPLGLTLKGLHDVVQAAMGWQDYHLYAFHVGETIYDDSASFGFDGRRTLRARVAKLASLVDRGVTRFTYVCDFGDDWEHLITVEAVEEGAPGVAYPRLVDGARRGPPEDVGGPPGYLEFLKAATNPRHRRHKEVIAWYGGAYDPDDIGDLAVRVRIGQIAKRRRAGKRARAAAGGPTGP
ncbi:plasmid pRiA4b ORF-3 family protein [Elioraea sp.]|uniref:plasmid pRiA4b ORF-3 family protein n=1 Tax=Elioraea sp. TaxID=2185103 RepID=UPI003F6F3560